MFGHDSPAEMPKPFTAAKLAQVVRQSLDKTGRVRHSE
jgi:hypothetical protein